MQGKYKKRILDLMKDNRGSTIVMVLVAFLFVSVLVSIIMASVVVNFRMRAIDRKTKDEFYYAEKALNDVYAGLGENCASALGSAYNVTMSKYSASSTGSYQDQVLAYDEFCGEFLRYIYTSIGDSYGLSIGPGYTADDKKALINKMNEYIVGNRAKVISIGDIKYLESDRKELLDTSEDKYPSIKYTVIKNVKIVSDMSSSDNTGYMSGVTADIVIETPQIDFFTVNEKDLDYAIAASNGIEFNGDATIKGSVYGGSRPTAKINDAGLIDEYKGALGGEKYMTDASDYGGILVDGKKVSIDGEYVVSGGDIYIKNDGELTITHNTKNEVWFDNITVEGNGAKLKIDGDLYAQGDIQVEGDNAEVIIGGNYYGYNNGAYESKADELTDDVGRNKANASSKYSSVIVNADEAKVDMTGLDTLVLLGKAFINHESKRTKDSNSLSVIGDDNNVHDDYKTKSEKDDIGESVALRSGQQIFLCPTEFLKGELNPKEFSDATFDFSVDKKSMRKWFGWQYLDEDSPVRTVKLSKNGVHRAYCYLNFAGTGDTKNKNQRKYVEDIVNGISSVDSCEPKPETMRTRLAQANRLQKSEIRIGNDNTRIYANGSIVQYEPGEDDGDVDTSSLGTISVKGNTEDFKRYNNYGGDMHYKYQSLCTYLDPVTNRKNTVESVSIDDYENEDLPFGRLFWLNGVEELAEGEVLTSRVINDQGKYVDYIKGCDSTVIVCRGAEGDAFYEGKMAPKYGSAVDVASVLSRADINTNNATPTNVFMIVDGDAYVKDNVTINGFLYVNGELIVENGATLNVTYNSTLLDKRIEAELKRLKQEYLNEKKNNGDSAKVENCYDKATLIYYLLDYTISKNGSSIDPEIGNIVSSNVNSHRKYSIDEKTGEIANDVTSDYSQFMYFENWRKGQ
ncbi:MAG: hypothetical protein Q4D29_04315 [Lachnospiraceae bacterium]|nr:hypothetical protein [Lachnospiraceae bacterium]